MKKHFVYFYGSSKVVSGHNSLSAESIRKRNQIIGFEGIDVNPELVDFGEICFNSSKGNNNIGETGTLFPINKTIVPFRYLSQEDSIIGHLEDVISANENYVKSESIGFPLMMLKLATTEGYNRLDQISFPLMRQIVIDFKAKWCCYGHYYLHLLKVALKNKDYYPSEKLFNLNNSNLINVTYVKSDGTQLIVHADAGL